MGLIKKKERAEGAHGSGVVAEEEKGLFDIRHDSLRKGRKRLRTEIYENQK